MISDLWFLFFEGCWYDKVMVILELILVLGGENCLLLLRVISE